MALAVVVRMLDDDGDDYPRGALALRSDGTIEAWPPGDAVLENIVSTPIFVPEKRTAGADAAAFLQGLHQQYRSPYLRAERAADLSEDDLAAIEYEAALTIPNETVVAFAIDPTFESKHPRAPEGTAEGGTFIEKPGGATEIVERVYRRVNLGPVGEGDEDVFAIVFTPGYTAPDFSDPENTPGSDPARLPILYDPKAGTWTVALDAHTIHADIAVALDLPFDQCARGTINTDTGHFRLYSPDAILTELDDFEPHTRAARQLRAGVVTAFDSARRNPPWIITRRGKRVKGRLAGLITFAVDPAFEGKHPRAPEGTTVGGQFIEAPGGAAAPWEPMDVGFTMGAVTGTPAFKAKIQALLEQDAAGIPRGWVAGLNIDPLPSAVKDCTGDYAKNHIRTQPKRGTLLHEIGHHVDMSDFVQRPESFRARLRELFYERRNAVLDVVAKSRTANAAKVLKVLENIKRNLGIPDVRKSAVGLGSAYKFLRGIPNLPTVSAYAMSNPREYWAESFEQFYENPTYLKLKDPKMFDFITEVRRASTR